MGWRREGGERRGFVEGHRGGVQRQKPPARHNKTPSYHRIETMQSLRDRWRGGKGFLKRGWDGPQVCSGGSTAPPPPGRRGGGGLYETERNGRRRVGDPLSPPPLQGGSPPPPPFPAPLQGRNIRGVDLPQPPLEFGRLLIQAWGDPRLQKRPGL